MSFTMKKNIDNNLIIDPIQWCLFSSQYALESQLKYGPIILRKSFVPYIGQTDDDVCI